MSLIFLSGPITNTVRTVWLSAAVRPPDVAGRLGGQHVVELRDLEVGSPIIGKFGAVPCVSSMSFAQPSWLSTGSTDRPMTFTPRLSNSGLSLAT